MKMRRVIRQLYLMSLSIFGVFDIYRKRNRQKVLVMVYHDVVSDEYEIPGHYNYNTTVNKSTFKKQISYLYRHYNFITLSQFHYWMRSGCKLPSNPVLLTFDDGHENLFKNAVPIMDEYGIKGVFFVKSEGWGQCEQNYCEKFLSHFESKEEGCKAYHLFRTKNLHGQQQLNEDFEQEQMYDNLNPEKYNHMSAGELIDLINNGHEIQSHSRNHYIMSSLSDFDSNEEMVHSKLTLESKLQNEVYAYAYPFGDPKFDFGERECSNLQKSGYIYGFQGEWVGTYISRDVDKYNIPRMGDVNTDFLYFKYLISSFRLKWK